MSRHCLFYPSYIIWVLYSVQANSVHRLGVLTLLSSEKTQNIVAKYCCCESQVSNWELSYEFEIFYFFCWKYQKNDGGTLLGFRVYRLKLLHRKRGVKENFNVIIVRGNL